MHQLMCCQPAASLFVLNGGNAKPGTAMNSVLVSKSYARSSRIKAMTVLGRTGVKPETKISPGSVQDRNAAVLRGHSPCGMSLRTNTAWYESTPLACVGIRERILKRLNWDLGFNFPWEAQRDCQMSGTATSFSFPFYLKSFVSLQVILQ